MKKVISVFLIIIILIALAAGWLFFGFPGYEVYSDVSYGSSECEIMDIYIPRSVKHRGEDDPCGAVLFIHGGSWKSGDKSEEALRCRYLASRGYIVASMNYTLYSDERADVYNVGVVLDEIDAALARIVSFAGEQGILVDKAATSGYSAGAHLSMLYSFSRGGTAPVDIKFTANLAGPADISPDIWGDELSERIGEMLTGEDIAPEELGSDEVKRLLESISPVTYVDADTPPALFVYGGKDDLVSAKNGDSLVRAFRDAGAEYEYIFMPDSTHILLQNPLKHAEYMIKLWIYCDKYF